MKEYHEKINSLNKLKPQKGNNKKRKQEVLTMLAIFIMNCVTFTKVNTAKK